MTWNDTKVYLGSLLASEYNNMVIDQEQRSKIITGAGAPTITPTSGGWLYYDTTGSSSYIAQNTTGSADWEQITTLSNIQTLTNKSIDSDNNTITNIANADIKAGAAIDWSKVSKTSSLISDLGDADYISTSGGELLYYHTGSSSWYTLTPGTTGHILYTSGVGANPYWAAATGGGGGTGNPILTFSIDGELSVGNKAFYMIPPEFSGLSISEIRVGQIGNVATSGTSTNYDIRKNANVAGSSILTNGSPIRMQWFTPATNNVYQAGVDVSGANIGSPDTTINASVNTVTTNDTIWISITQIGSPTGGADSRVQMTFS